MRKEWRLKKTDQKEAAAFAKRLGVSPFLAGLLQHRGLDKADTAEAFLHPEQQPFLDPFLLKGMTTAVERIQKAVENKERITIYGDYDVDGITSSSLLWRFLHRAGADVHVYIPDRQREGYGLHREALERILSEKTKLLISVDCGISAVEEVAVFQGKMDFLITDHHLPGDCLPEALAIIDPHQSDCPYPEKTLAGVGVAFKLCQALAMKSRGLSADDFSEDMELVALGTVADIVPLLGENRKIVQMGLERIKDTKIPGLQALLAVTGLEKKEISSGQVGFVLAPRLNAAGRLETAMQGVELLRTEDPSKARTLAEELNTWNVERQNLEQEILAQAKAQVEKDHLADHPVLLVAGEGWHPGVIGIVASRLVECYYRPTIVIGMEEGIGKGSCRSIEGFHMYEALSKAKDLLLGFGGHAQAAGLTVEKDKIPELLQILDAFAEEKLTVEDYVPKIDVEAELAPDTLDFSLLEDLAQLEPFGMGNPRPVFGCHHVRGSYAQCMGKEGRHLRFQLEGTEKNIRAIAWNRGEDAGLVNRVPLDILYVPEINEWRGTRSIQCKISDFSPVESLPAVNRELLGKIYLGLRKLQGAEGEILQDEKELQQILSKEIAAVSPELVPYGLKIFQELGLLQQSSSGAEGRYQMVPPTGKMDLRQSPTYCQCLQRNKDFQ